MEKNKRAIDSRLTNRQIAKKEAEAARRRRKTLVQRIGVGVGAGLSILATAGVIYQSQNDSQEDVAVHAPSEHSFNLPQITESDVKSLAMQGVHDYERVLGIDVDSDRFISNLYLAPNSRNMTPEEYEKFCGRGFEIKCQTAFAAVRNGDNEAYVYKDAVDTLFGNYPNTQEAKLIRDEYILHSTNHELGHWLPVNQGISDELYDLTIQYFGEDTPEIKDKTKYVKNAVNGAEILGKEVDGEGGFSVFLGLEEAEVEVIALYVLNNSGRTVKGDHQNNTYFLEQRVLLTDLLTQLNPDDYGDSIKLLMNVRQTEGGREELMRTVGKKFGATDENALEHGFQIMRAVNNGDAATFKLLTGKQN